MQTMTLNLDRAGQFLVHLATQRAPHNCQLLSDRLPLELDLRHSKFSGQALETRIPGLIATAENPSWYETAPGCLGVEYPIPGQPDFGLGLVLVYGPMFQYRTAYAPLGVPLHIVGVLEGDLSALFRAGQLYQEHGQGRLRLAPGR